MAKDLGPYQAIIEDMRLVDFKVRITQGGIEAVTRVTIDSEDSEGRRWATVGVSPNIVDASFEALLDRDRLEARPCRRGAREGRGGVRPSAGVARRDNRSGRFRPAPLRGRYLVQDEGRAFWAFALAQNIPTNSRRDDCAGCLIRPLPIRFGKGDPDRVSRSSGRTARPPEPLPRLPLRLQTSRSRARHGPPGEPMIAEMRLQWWRDALGEIGAGDKVRSHPVTLALAEVLDPEGAEALDRLVAARRFDIYREPHCGPGRVRRLSRRDGG